MDSSETLLLRWNEFEPNVKQGFSQLRSEADFYDVTLSCGESGQIKAHKVILATYSTFFKSLLRSISHDHPLLYLRGIHISHLESLISFMYEGEARVRPEDLDAFLAVATELKINGLMSSQEPAEAPNTEQNESLPVRISSTCAKRTLNQTNSKSKIAKLSAQEETKQEPEFQDVFESNEYTEVKMEDQERHEDTVAEETPTISEKELNEQLDAQINKWISPRDPKTKQFKCLKCPYSTGNFSHAKNHVEAKHFVTNGFTCDKCSKKFKTRESLYKHKASHKKDPEFFATDIL
uniref:Longitudinals lacking protein-like n=1 Tax=Caligus rogercresseyi TaxID=217165 RepID=C1BQM7_CALRO|nr:Longitudinals lacking protein-like [Caligus rogercresseyi]